MHCCCGGSTTLGFNLECLFYPGRYCLQTVCDTQPCLNGGLCKLTSTDFRCICPKQYGGQHCEKLLNPCEISRPCSGNGICIAEDGSGSGSNKIQDVRQLGSRSRGRISVSSMSYSTNAFTPGVDSLQVAAPGETLATETVAGYRCQCHLWWTGRLCTF